jgi:hypothetical protein
LCYRLSISIHQNLSAQCQLSSSPARIGGTSHISCPVQSLIGSIGLEFVKLYAEKGWKIFGACRKPDAVSAKVDGNVEWIKLDCESLTDAKDVR